jgi:leucyl aminopeptidase (aminopeptidase T)
VSLAERVARDTFALRERDVMEVYCYPHTIPLAEALALAARRRGSDTHLTLMSDDLWFTSMEFLPVKWLKAPSPVEVAISGAVTADVYVGSLTNPARFSEIPLKKITANSIGGEKQNLLRRRHKVRNLVLPVGMVTEARAQRFGLSLARWRAGFEAALGVSAHDLRVAGRAWKRALAGRRRVRVVTEAGTDVTFETGTATPYLADGTFGAEEKRREITELWMPAGRVFASIRPGTAEGTIALADPLNVIGTPVGGVRLTVREGEVVAASAKTNRALLDRALGPAPRRIGWFSIGVNAASGPCLFDNSIVRDVVTFGFGAHTYLGAKRGASAFQGVTGPAEIAIGR